VVATQWIFRQHFNNGRHGKVPDHNTIKNWVEMFWTTDSATNKKPGGSFRTVWAPENIERVWATIGHSPKRSDADICCPQYSKQITLGDTAFWLIVTPLQNADCARTVKPWFCFRKSVLWAMCYLRNKHPYVICYLIMSDEAHFELLGSVNKQNMIFQQS